MGPKGKGGKGEAIDFTSPRTSSGQASQSYEMVPIGTIVSPSEGFGRKPQGENHKCIGFEEWKTSHMQRRVKSRTQAAARTWTPAVAVRGKCVTTAPPKLLPSKTIEAASTVKFVPSCDTKPLVWMDCCSIWASCVGAGGVGVANTIW